MKVLLHVWSLAKPLLDGRLQSTDLPVLAAGAGFRGLEWLDRLLPSYDPDRWENLARAGLAAGLEPGALSLGLELNASPARVAEQVDRLKVLLGRAPRLGVETVRLAIGGGSASLSRLLLTLEGLRPRPAREGSPLGPLSRLVYARAAKRLREDGPPLHHLPPRADGAALQSAAWALQPLARMAGDLGLKLGLENHFGLTSHPEDMLALIELVAPAPLGICLDLGNFIAGQDALAACRALASHAVHVHFKIHGDRPDEEAERLDYAGRLEALREVGFAGAFSVEYEGPGEGLDQARAGAEVLRRLWRRFGSEHQLNQVMDDLFDQAPDAL